MKTKYNINDKYIHFPLNLIQLTYHDHIKGWDIIISFGIVNYAKKIKYEINDVTRQLMYAYYRKKELIQKDLFTIIEKFMDNSLLTFDEDYNGFTGKSFNPLENKSELLDLFEEYPEFKEAAVLRYQIEQAIGKDNLNVTLKSIDNTIALYNEGLNFTNDFTQKFGNDCYPSLKIKMAMDIRNSDKDYDLYRAYIAIKSLIGHNKYIETSKGVILMRMFGCRTSQALLDFLKSSLSIKNQYDRYSRSEKAMRYNFDKLFEGLYKREFIRGKLFVRGISRKLFLSVELTNDELADRIIDNTKRKNLRNNEQEAIKKIRATI